MNHSSDDLYYLLTRAAAINNSAKDWLSTQHRLPPDGTTFMARFTGPAEYDNREVLCQRRGSYLYRANTGGALLEMTVECPRFTHWRLEE